MCETLLPKGQQIENLADVIEETEIQYDSEGDKTIFDMLQNMYLELVELSDQLEIEKESIS